MSEHAHHGSPRAIVLGVEHPRGVAVVHSLGRAGIPVVAVDCDRTARGFFSRYIREKFVISAQPDAALAAIESLATSDGGIVIPTNDWYVRLVATHWERLAATFTLTLPPWETLVHLMDKPRCYRLAEEIGIAAPRFFSPADAAELEEVVAGLDFAQHDYLLTAARPMGAFVDPTTGRFTRVAGRTPATLRERCLEVLARTGRMPVISEVVPGHAAECIGVSLVMDKRHEVAASYCVRRLQLRPYASGDGFVHPYELGANVYCESAHDAEAVEAAQRLLRHAEYYGVATVEFRRNSTDGRLTLIKVDPRVVRATGLSTALGADVPLALYRVFTGGAARVPESYADGVGWIWPTWYVDTVWRLGEHRALLRALAQLVRSARHVRAAAYFSARDPLPFLVDVWRWAGRWLPGAPAALRRAVVRYSSAARHALGLRTPS